MDINANENLKKWVKDKRNSSSQDECVCCSNSLATLVTLYESSMGMGDVRLQPGVLPSGGLSALLDYRDCQHQGLCMLDPAKELLRAVFAVWGCVRPGRDVYLSACCLPSPLHLPACAMEPGQGEEKKKSSVSETTFSVIQLIRFNLWNVTVNGENLELWWKSPSPWLSAFICLSRRTGECCWAYCCSVLLK